MVQIRGMGFGAQVSVHSQSHSLSPNRARCNTNTTTTKILNCSVSFEHNSFSSNKNHSTSFKHNSLNCFYTNATSLKNKFEELLTLVSINNFDIIFITESWFDNFYHPGIPGFDLYFTTRQEKIGGGVCIYIKQHLKSYELTTPEFCNSKAEQVWCCVEINSERILAGCIYRPPKGGECDQAILDSIRKSNDFLDRKNFTGMLICGDFNCPKINWHSGDFTSCDLNSDSFEWKLIDIFDDYFNVQHVQDYTFQTTDGRPSSLIDLIVTDDSNRIYSIKHDAPLGAISRGHHVLTWNYELKCSISEVKSNFNSIPFNYRRANFNSISDFIKNVDWGKHFENLTVEQMYDSFLNFYRDCCESFIPRKQCTMRINKPWINSVLKSKIKAKKSAWSAFKASGWAEERVYL